jgi:hypothetical protein
MAITPLWLRALEWRSIVQANTEATSTVVARPDPLWLRALRGRKAKRPSRGPRPRTAALLGAICLLHMEGLSIREIAKQLGLAKNTVSRCLVVRTTVSEAMARKHVRWRAARIPRRPPLAAQ